MLPGVAFSNNSFSFNSGAKQFSPATIFSRGNTDFLTSFLKLACTLTIFGDYGIFGHIPYWLSQ